MDLDRDPPDGEDTGIQAEGRVTQKPCEVPVPLTPPQEQPCPYFRPGWTLLLPWLTIPSMCLGFFSVYFQFMTFTHVSRSTARFREEAELALWMAAAAILLGLLGYWLSRRELTRIEKEVAYPRARPVTIESRRWALIGLVCGTLGLIIGTVIVTLT